ncbi:hypothetical protein NOF04DRAFT_1269046 [Fusarium oxysporum II5]|uniref:SnoaL-like domain-containing protein n=1 Tax=Fusarium odoratissimum (strain NRRL 54006) TaxID=1089451 RepID=X0KR25_FUSO5|nr:uncharacterized protein FOIG_00998 [Fusarium odoratissimum NRRL 54006]XP_031073301.1 uncharacterized protein FOIG_00998 [Fusarium odoratissimum NRRL 54006]EXM11211.1 hypothetical protein FOIG_00998 [Fusarium odoratissimum NRRL 54006]EXM11212.1 hypothetical protein FOIG_00998 [Fusarium odoratissimum NRRL 54006]KAK2136970.1 hypothetical protein NOF04DRAFT_1269046 [Fusarium oxysporum II5]
MASPLTDAKLSQSLQSIVDKDEIHHKIRHLVQSVYHPDAIGNHGSFKGPAKDFYDIMTAADSTRAVHHQIGQSLIELGPDGTTASAETYCTATTVNEADGQETSITFLVRYVDQFEKRDGSWKISHRFVAFDAVSDKAIMQYLPKANLGTRDEEDYSRKVLKD